MLIIDFEVHFSVCLKLLAAVTKTRIKPTPYLIPALPQLLVVHFNIKIVNRTRAISQINKLVAGKCIKIYVCGES